MEKCEHPDFDAIVVVDRITKGEGGPVEHFMAVVKIECSKCHLPFQFMGLELGLNLRGATMSVEQQEARLAIAPRGSVPTMLDGLLGFGVRPPGAKLDG